MFQLPSPIPSKSELADWIELNLLFEHEDRISRADIYDVLETDPEYDEPMEDFSQFDWEGGTLQDESSLRDQVHSLEAEGQSNAERLVEDTWQELQDRASIIGETYPLFVGESSIRCRTPPDQTIVYSFLALLGARLTYRIKVAAMPVSEPAMLFEFVVKAALENYLGAKTIRFGWPYRDDGLGTDFFDAARALAGELQEHVGPLLTVGDDEKDHGLDVIAWLPFSDNQPSQISLLCQCAIGQDWNEKPIHLKNWDDIINFMVSPLTAVAFVVQMSNEKRYLVNGVAKRSGVLFDRTRLAKMVGGADLPAELTDKITAWATNSIGHIPVYAD